MRSKKPLWLLKSSLAFIPLALSGAVLPQEVFASSAVVSARFFDWSISGKVTSSTGEPLPGVTVLLKGTTNGASTGPDGSFSLSVPEAPGTLVFSFIGFTTQEKSFSGPGAVNVTLTDDTKALDEVVVVGYGTQKKANITGAVATMDAERLTERPVARVDQALVGQMAGVRVQQTSGVPGRGFSIQVRGTGSITANNEPLYVIDGFPLAVQPQNSGGGFSSGNPLDNINPNDIESIQVLKDASAAAIYGSRASNGVVLITTKKGKSGKAKISFGTYAGINKTAKKLDVLNADEWIDRAIESINYNWVRSAPGRTTSQTTEERREILGLPAGSVNRNYMIDERWLQPGHPGLEFVDWQDELFRTGVVQNYQLSASGGTDAVSYYVSGDYLDQEGVAIGLDYKRYTARANVEVKANDKLRLGINISPSYSITNDPGVEGKDQQMHLAVSMPPVVEASAGVETGVAPNNVYTWGPSRVSPVAVAREALGETKIFRTLGTIYGQYDILPGLSFRTTFNLDHADGTTESWLPAKLAINRNTTGSLVGYRRQTFVNENTLTYNHSFAGVHHFSALAGTSYSNYTFDSWRLNGAGFSSDEIPTLNQATSFTGASNKTRNVLISYFGRLQYDYNDRYLLSASIRRDASSRFGDETQWGIFPSASVGWRVSQESFMQDITVINELKLRASWGIAGNNGVGDYDDISRLQVANYSLGGTLTNGQVPQNFPNPRLGWEESETVDIGLDLGLFGNRIFSSFDYYTKTNRDLLLNIPVPTASGFTTALTNIGRVVNKGWEAELTSHNLTGAFEWNTSINFSHNENEVEQLGPNNTPIPGGDWDINHNLLMVGQPMYSIWVVHQVGLLTQEDIESGYPLYGNQEPGDPKYLDANNDGQIDANDRVLSGHPNPDYVWGVTNTFRYKGFDLNVLVQGQWGGKIYSTFGRAVDRTGMDFIDNTLGKYRDRWRSPEYPGDGETRKAPSSFGRIKNTDWLYPSDYWRVRNITLGYNLGGVLKSNFISGARVYVTAENWFGKDKYTGGFNPEAVNNGGDDYGSFPLSKSMIMGLNLTF
ncbi:SusC/RagA family TonB-linked outer membrane protein [Pontibacter silvestris]|uniref:SusC/RagA family TonB-linked outer membrane protein n=1 Tax=Pontibacter silvestris TaxID=2305183 RepID=A0ABW4WZM7_9BACT|nr:TonB-dependent receptor [Pontibacter silvestris]MCC9135599.1 TonB-dependent receptor [Pontibacter silvestris]